MDRNTHTRRFGRVLAGCGILLLATQLQGCATFTHQAGIAYANLPRELDKVTLPQYRVEPPDILLIEAVNNVRPPDTPLQAGDQLLIQLQNGLPLDIGVDAGGANPLQQEVELQLELAFKLVNGIYQVLNDGTVDLGPAYGNVHIAGLTLEQAQAAIEFHLKERVGLLAPNLSVSLTDIAGKQPISGEHLVRPDGTVGLGIYGEAYVAGLTLPEVKMAVESHLSQFIHEPEISVDVIAYNSKVVYVITDGGGFGETIVRLPVTGNETVLDAIAQINGLSQVSSKKIWVARPAPSELAHAQILDVHWEAITAEGITATNYQLLPGDRIYISADHLIATDNFLAKLFAPIERIAGMALLMTGAARSIEFYSTPGGGFGGGP